MYRLPQEIFLACLAVLLSISLFYPLIAMENSTDQLITVHLNNSEKKLLSSKTFTDLCKHSSTLQAMACDCSIDTDNALHLPQLTNEQFKTVTTFIQRSTSKPFPQLCKGPTAQKLIELLYATELLDINTLQEAIIAELAHRYYTYPSLAKRHICTNNRKYERYKPHFKHTHAEAAIAEAITKLAKANVLNGDIERLKIISDNIENTRMTLDNKYILTSKKILNTSRPGDIALWNSTTGQLCRMYISEVDGHCEPIVTAYGPKILVDNGKNPYIKDFFTNKVDKIVKTYNGLYHNIHYSRTVGGYLDTSVHITPDTNAIIVSYGPDGYIFRQPSPSKRQRHPSKGSLKNWKWKKINRVDRPFDEFFSLDWNFVRKRPFTQRYTTTFKHIPCITPDSEYLLFKCREGVQKVSIKTPGAHCFDLREDLTDNVSAIALVPNSSYILAGMCTKECRTMVKIVDFNTGAIIKSINIGTLPHSHPFDKYHSNNLNDLVKHNCSRVHEHLKAGYPYEYITSIVPTPDGSKAIVSSRSLKTHIIDLSSNKSIQSFDSGLDSVIIGVNPDATKIIALQRAKPQGPKQLALYGNIMYERLACRLTATRPLQEALAILSTQKCRWQPSRQEPINYYDYY